MVSMDPGVWLSAFFILAIFSFAFKQNPLFKLAEHIFVAASVGYAVSLAVSNIQRFAVTPISRGDAVSLIPCVLGVLLYFQYSSRYYWISRYGTAFLVGITMVVSFRASIKASFISQIAMAITPLMQPDILADISGLVTLAAFVTVTYFFVFTVPRAHRGRLGKIAIAGRYFIMAALGGSFGNTVVTRMKLLIGQLLYLLSDWLGLIR